MNAFTATLNHHTLALQARLQRLLPEALLQLLARLALAAIFWRSGRTKVEGLFSLTEGAISLFEEEYRLPWIDPTLAAGLAAAAEHVLPILLVLGLFTRFAAAGLLIMTLVIQVLVYPDAWPTHLSWLVLQLSLLVRGGGGWALDAWLRRRLFRSTQDAVAPVPLGQQASGQR